jgi:two-component system, chemotaxis family, response regulator Rcp1
MSPGDPAPTGPNNLDVVRDGIEALAFLERQGTYANAVRSDLFVLDLNRPKVDGRQVRAQIKSNPELRPMPVVILATSEAEQDILRSHDLQANCYVTKTVDLGQFITVVRSIESFWLTSVTLPAR